MGTSFQQDLPRSCGTEGRDSLDLTVAVNRTRMNLKAKAGIHRMLRQ